MRMGAQDPALIAVLLNQAHRSREKVFHVLDIGCGEGRFSRKIVELGNNIRVTAFDSAPHSIEIAQGQKSPGIEYHVAAAKDFHVKTRFDAAISEMVLPYAQDLPALREIFACARRHLKETCAFSSVIFNPRFEAFDTRIGNRMYSKSGERSARVHFLDEVGQETFSADWMRFTETEYEESAKREKFRHVEWLPVAPTREAEEAFPDGYWNAYKAHHPYALLKAY